jgi:nesprin-1
VVWPLLFLIQELQKALDKRKAIVLSVNLCSAEFVQCDSEESREMQRQKSETALI